MAVAVVLAAGPVAAGDKPAAKIDGTYEVVEILADGKPSPKAKEVTSVEIKDGVISINGAGKKEEGAKFKLDPAKTPAEIDITPLNEKELVAGIYQTKETDKGLELNIAFAKGGGPRPKDFKGEGKGEVVLKLFRKK
jgi:uncharacterized protein (TIGR03067 family)